MCAVELNVVADDDRRTAIGDRQLKTENWARVSRTFGGQLERRHSSGAPKESRERSALGPIEGNLLPIERRLQVELINLQTSYVAMRKLWITCDESAVFGSPLSDHTGDDYR